MTTASVMLKTKEATDVMITHSMNNNRTVAGVLYKSESMEHFKQSPR